MNSNKKANYIKPLLTITRFKNTENNMVLSPSNTTYDLTGVTMDTNDYTKINKLPGKTR